MTQTVTRAPSKARGPQGVRASCAAAGATDATATWNDVPVPPATPADDLDRLPEGIQTNPRIDIPDASQAYRVTLSDGPSMASPDRYAMRLLTSILGDDGGSRLFWDLVDTGRAEIATLWGQEFAETGGLFTYLVCGPDQMESNTRLMNEAIEIVARDGVDEDELKQVINKTVAGVIMSSERPSQRLFSMGSRWLCCREHLALDELLDAYRAVDVDAIGRVAKAYLQSEPTEVIAAASLAHT
jgi:predicted Zn-dependent peptidase